MPPLSLTIAPLGAGPDDAGKKLEITDLEPTDTVQHLKRAIARELRRPGDWSQISLWGLGSPLADDRTLEECGLQDADEIQIGSSFSLRPTTPPPATRPTKQLLHKAPADARSRDRHGWKRPDVAGPQLKNLAFTDLDGKTFMLQNVPIHLTFKQLEEILWFEKDMDMDFLRLIFGGKQLTGNETLDVYGLKEESTIMIVARLHGGVGNT